VSGVLVFAKSLAVARLLRDQFAAHKPRRRYLALVTGRVSPSEGTIRSHLATDRDLNRYSTADAAKGELAVTHYRLLKAGPWRGGTRAAVAAGTADISLLAVWLETGRRNQIRVHLAERGHAVLGDRRYGKQPPAARPAAGTSRPAPSNTAAGPAGPAPAAALHPAWPYRRLALHAESLAFDHPLTGQPLKFTARPPQEFERLAARLTPEPANGARPKRGTARGAPRHARRGERKRD
jgi:23S rRNA pseudouridine1911/1915/1917 synthase